MMATEENNADKAERTQCDLPVHPTSEAVQAVYENLLSARGTAIEIDASQVGRVSAPLIQVLVAAHKDWLDTNLPFEITTPSEGFEKGTLLLGLSHDHFTAGETA